MALEMVASSIVPRVARLPAVILVGQMPDPCGDGTFFCLQEATKEYDVRAGELPACVGKFDAQNFFLPSCEPRRRFKIAGRVKLRITLMIGIAGLNCA